MATKSQEILLKGNTTNASAVPSSLKIREIAINALDRSLFTNDGNSIVKLYTGTNKWFDVNGNANNALKLGGILASEYINKEAFNSHINNTTIHITTAERTTWNNKWDYNEEIIKAVKVNAAVLADKATIANSINTFIDSSISTPSAGWYRIAYYPTRDMVRGLTEFQICTFGGANTPIVNTIRINGSWSLANIDNCFIDGTRYYITKIRSTYDDTNVYIEFYCIAAISAYLRVLHNNASVGNVNETWKWYTGALPEGGGTEVSLSDGYIDYVKTAETLRATRYIFGQPFDGSSDCNGDMNVTGKATIQGDIISGGEVVAIAGEGTPAGVTDYSALTGKPSINGVTLVSGNNTLAALGIQAAGDYATNSGITTLLANYADKTFVSNNYAGKSAFNNHTADSDIHITSTERKAWNAKWDYDEATIKAVKVTSASSADSVAWSGIKDKPTTIAGYGITDVYTATTIDSKLSGYLPLSGGTLAGSITLPNINITSTASRLPSHYFHYLYGGDTVYEHFGYYGDEDKVTYGQFRFYNGSGGYKTMIIGGDGRFAWDGSNVLTTSNFNSYAPTLTGTGASGTWGINISGNAATATNATNADKLDGVHYQNILEREYSGISSSGTATGWFRIAESLATNVSSITFLLAIQRAFYYTSNESYLFSISINYDGGINITQLSGYANTRLITKIRVDWVNGKIAYVDLYIASSSTNNAYYWYTIGCAKSYTEWTANPTLVGTAYEFTTVQGCKSDRGFTGDLVGNSSSATKLQTPRNIFGLPFDGISDVNGDAHITGDLVVDGEVSALVA